MGGYDPTKDPWLASDASAPSKSPAPSAKYDPTKDPWITPRQSKPEVSQPSAPKQGVGSYSTLQKLVNGFEIMPNHGMFMAPKVQRSIDPMHLKPSDFAQDVSRGRNRGLTPLTGKDIQQITAPLDAGLQSVVRPLLGSNPIMNAGPLMAHTLQTANAFTGGLGSTLFPQTFGEINKAGDTGSPLANEVLGAAENVAPYLTPAAPIALAGSGASTAINVAEGNESLAAGAGDFALMAAGLKGFKAAGAVEKMVPRIAANVGISEAMYAGGQAVHGAPVTAGGAIGAGITAVPFGIKGHAAAPDILDHVVSAIAGHESGGDYSATNKSSKGTALGKYQVMDYNLSGFLKKAELPDMTSQEYLADPDAQDAVGKAIIGKNLSKNLRRADGDIDEAVRLTAIDHYGDMGAKKNRNARRLDLHPNGDEKQPTPNQYADDVLSRFHKSKGVNNATQTGNIQPNGQSEYSGAVEGTEAPADGSEVRPEEGALAGRGDRDGGEAQESTARSVEPSAPELPLDDQDGIQIDQPVLRGQIEESVSGGHQHGSDRAQLESLDGGIPADGQDRQNNAEGPDARARDFGRDRGDESIRQGAPGENETASRSDHVVSDALEVSTDASARGRGPNDSEHPAPIEGVHYGERPILREAARGDKTSVQSPTGNEYDGHYAVVDLSEITPSNDPRSFSAHSDYPPQVQDRDYAHSHDEQAKVIRNGNDLSPAHLINDSPVSDVGPPIVDSKGRVAGGNGRSMSMVRSFASDPKAQQEYKATLVKKASQFGIDPEAIRAEKNPVLVRVLPDVELKSDQQSAALVRELNLSQTTEKDATASAISAGNSLTPEQHEAIGQVLEKHETLGDAFGDAATSKQLIRSLEKGNIITNENRPRLVEQTKRGPMLSDAGKDFVTDLMASRVLKDPEVARQTPPAIRQKIAKAALPLAQAGRFEGWSLEHPIREAIEDINAQRASGLNDQEWRSQISFEREPLSRAGEAMRNLLADTRQKPLREFAERYANEARADKGESTDEMFGKPERDPAETLVKLAEQATGKAIEGRPRYTRDDFSRDLQANTKLRPASSLAVTIPGAEAVYRDVASIVRKEIVPALRTAAKGVGEAAGQAQGLLAPSSRGEMARIMKGVMRENMAEFARKSDILNAAWVKIQDSMEKLPVDILRRFNDNFERGVAQDTQELQVIDEGLRALRDGRVDEVRALGTGKLQQVYENYLAHIWKDPAKAIDSFKEFFSGKRPFEGNKSWTRQRTIEYMSEGRAKGLELVSENPVTLTLTRVHQMDKFIMAHKVMNEAKKLGISKYRRAFEPLQPGETKINDTIGTVYGNPKQPIGPAFDKMISDNPMLAEADLSDVQAAIAEVNPETNVHGAVIAGYYVMPEPAARLINNYLSPGLQEKSAAFRGYRALANTMNQFQLGWSGFHAGFVTMDAITSRFALGIYEAAHGDVLKGLRTSATSLTLPIQSFIEGNKMMKEWSNPGSQGEIYSKLIQAEVQGGGRAKMDAFYSNNAWKRMTAAWNDSQGPIEKIVRAGLRLPFALTEKAMAPIQEYLVPRMKQGLFAQMAQYEMEKLGPDATLQQTRDAYGKVWDSVDNRLGQLVYDNLFWNRTTKDIAMASVRSLGWNLGTFRELGGGVIDWGRFGKNLLTPGEKADFTHRMAYTIALPAVTALFGAIAQKILTGDAPGELKDYFYPKTGATEADGTPARMTLPTYMKDVYAYYDDEHKALTIGGNPFRTVMNKLHPAVASISEMLQNKDYYGVQIRNEDDPIMQQLKDVAMFGIRTIEPFAIQGIARNLSQQPFGASTILPMIGVTPAPKSLEQTPAEELLTKYSEEHRTVGSRTKAEAEKSQQRYDLEAAYRTRDKAAAQKIVHSGALSVADIKLAQKQALIPRDAARFSRLPLEEKLNVYERMSPEERSLFAGYNHDGMTLTVRAKLQESYMNELKQGRIRAEDAPALRARMIAMGRLPHAPKPTHLPMRGNRLAEADATAGIRRAGQ